MALVAFSSGAEPVGRERAADPILKSLWRDTLEKPQNAWLHECSIGHTEISWLWYVT
jgi:hypothetical protein